MAAQVAFAPADAVVGLDVVWRQLVALTGIGAALFGYALACFRATIGTMV